MSPKRCFIVGTGPSLKTTVGLDALWKEDTFGLNKLSEWEDLPFIPTFYGANFTEVMEGYSPKEPKCIRERFLFYNPHDNIQGVDGWTLVAKRLRYDLSDDEIVGLGDTLPPIPGGGTIPMTAAQLALWMGYREIYLLGVDQSPATTANQLVGRPDGYPALTMNFVRWASWEWFREYCEAGGVIVQDCTPGGQLSAGKILEYRALESLWT